MDRRGIMIVLEGSDGVGKATQTKELSRRLKQAGYDVVSYEFPRYRAGSSYFIKQYLKGHYGPAGEVSPYTASLFYALDRYEAAASIKKSLSQGKVVLADRFTGSNMAHQGSKFTSSAEQRGFFLWVEKLEFETLGIPRPDINLYLYLPPKAATERLSSRNQAKDAHEADDKHLNHTVQAYSRLLGVFPKEFIKIDCASRNKILTVKEVSELVWRQIQPLLKHIPTGKKN